MHYINSWFTLHYITEVLPTTRNSSLTLLQIKNKKYSVHMIQEQCQLPSLSVRPAVTFLAVEHHCQYQIILLGDRGTVACVWTTCPESLAKWNKWKSNSSSSDCDSNVLIITPTTCKTVSNCRDRKPSCRFFQAADWRLEKQRKWTTSLMP